VNVTADGAGVVSHAGAELLRELVVATGLVEAWDEVLLDTYKSAPTRHMPGQVLADLAVAVAVAVADGAKSISDLASLRDQKDLCGPVASPATAWRALDRVSADHLVGLREGRAAARVAAWAAGAGPDLAGELCLDFDATIVVAHSDKELATPTWKKTFGFHPLVCFLDRPDISSGEALAGVVREGRAGSNTTAEHIAVLDMALDGLPAQARPGQVNGPSLLARADAAGATHGFAAACRERLVGFSVGFAITAPVRAAIMVIPADAWSPAIEPADTTVSDDPSQRVGASRLRDGAWVTELTGLVNLSEWPAGSRLIVRKERAHPGASLTLFDIEAGFRHTAFLTDTAQGVVAGQVAGLELRQRQHARIEDRIRQAKAAGLANLPCRAAPENDAWLEVVLAAADLVAWSKKLCFADVAAIARCEIQTFRYRILHIAARITRGGRKVNLRLDQTWAWAKTLATAFERLRAAFA
jgi:hypothetical protein